MFNMNMNMNPMMGNINQMGMNNQLMTNFAMDDTALKIKAIIKNYRIRTNNKTKRLSNCCSKPKIK